MHDHLAVPPELRRTPWGTIVVQFAVMRTGEPARFSVVTSGVHLGEPAHPVPQPLNAAHGLSAWTSPSIVAQ